MYTIKLVIFTGLTFCTLGCTPQGGFRATEIEQTLRIPEVVRNPSAIATEKVLIEPSELATNVLSFHRDHLGNASTVTNGNGVVLQRSLLGPYGEIKKLTNAQGVVIAASASATPLMFTGHYYDWESGYHYANARYIDPTTKRFTSLDPALYGREPGATFGMLVSSVQATNPYAYVENRTTRMVDPSGGEGRLAFNPNDLSLADSIIWQNENRAQLESSGATFGVMDDISYVLATAFNTFTRDDYTIGNFVSDNAPTILGGLLSFGQSIPTIQSKQFVKVYHGSMEIGLKSILPQGGNKIGRTWAHVHDSQIDAAAFARKNFESGKVGVYTDPKDAEAFAFGGGSVYELKVRKSQLISGSEAPQSAMVREHANFKREQWVEGPQEVVNEVAVGPAAPPPTPKPAWQQHGFKSERAYDRAVNSAERAMKDAGWMGNWDCSKVSTCSTSN